MSWDKFLFDLHLTTCISCRRLMTLIIDNLTKGNRKNIESALIGGQLNAMVRHFI
jgi:hypothetical protein